MELGRPLYFHPVVAFYLFIYLLLLLLLLLLLFSSPNLSGRTLDVYAAIHRNMLLHTSTSLYIKPGKVSVRNVRTYVRNGGRGKLSSE